MAADVSANDARFAAESNPDVNAEKIGDVYAESLFGVLENEPKRIGEILEEFSDFITQALDAYPDFEQVLNSRLVSAEDKIGLLERVFGDKISPLFLNFLRVVAKHERLDCLRAIYQQTKKRQDILLGRIPVIVTAATPLKEEMLQKISASLRKMLKGDPEILHRTDPSLIGGLVVRVGDTIYDGSIAMQLKNICQNVIHHYVPEEEATKNS
ncbi:MAG: ATP synthase F1 subunit delta [Planctomycetia bacterium]|nr:ATP synthase F1 subunit delta [Planctomycetia bacterium]